MKVLPVDNTNFGKVYVYDKDYNSTQERYISDIHKKLNIIKGDLAYYERIENLGYDVWTMPSFKDDKIMVILSRANKNDNKKVKCVPVATVGEYKTDFNPEDALKIAETDKKVTSILNKVLLGLAVLLSVVAVGTCCREKMNQETAKALYENVFSIKSGMKNPARTLYIG